MKRFRWICLTAILAVCCLTVCTAAEEPDTMTVPELAAQTLTGEATADATDTAETADVPFGEVLLSVWNEHAAEIFSAMTLAMSVLLAWFYKRGLVPVLYGALNGISKSTEAAGKHAAGIAEAADGSLHAFLGEAEPVLTKIAMLCDTTATVAGQAAALEQRLAEAESDRALMKTLMTGVADILYGVFTSANLPQYAKEQIGQKYAALTAAIGGSDETKDTGGTV